MKKWTLNENGLREERKISLDETKNKKKEPEMKITCQEGRKSFGFKKNSLGVPFVGGK